MKTGLLSILSLLLGPISFASSAQTVFPQKPLDRTQILVWMDFGDESQRVVQLISRAGVDFQPTPDYLVLLKNTGATSKLIEAVTHATKTERSVSSTSDAAFAHLSTCMTSAYKKQFAEAESECNAATSDDPGVSYFALGNVLLKDGKNAAALEAIRAAEKADSSIPDTHNYAGLVMQSLKDLDGSMKEYEQAIRLDPDYETPHSNLVNGLIMNGDLRGAEREAREALRINPESPSAHNNQGGVYFKQKKMTEAITEMRKAAELEPNNAFRHANLASLLDLTGDHSEAAKEFDRAITLEPDQMQYHIGLIRALAGKNDMGMLLTECDTVEQRFPADDRFRQVGAVVRGQARSAAPSANAPAAAPNASMFVNRSAVPAIFRGNAGDMEKRLENMKAADFAAVQQKAAGGDAGSEFLVCAAYRLGQFVSQDDTKALPFCIKAAEQGDIGAQDNLGSMYMIGRGVKPDFKLAMEWMTTAAAQGSYASMSNLASMYANGMGVPKNYSEAMNWYRKAIEHGSMAAQTDIGIMYLQGEGVPKDPQQGIAWIRKSADANYPYAAELLGWAYQQGMGVSRSLKDSLEWFKKAAVLGDARSQTEIGFIYANGVGVSKDYKEAAKWYRLSAEQGDAAGAYGLGVRYMQGLGVPRDYNEAEKWFKVAAEKGHGDAAYNLGVLFEKRNPGQTGKPDHEAAAKYLQIAADQGIADGQCFLGTLFAAGNGVPRDNVAAYQWMTLAAQNGNPQCSQGITPLIPQMTTEQLAEAKRRATDWSPKPHPQFNY